MQSAETKTEQHVLIILDQSGSMESRRSEVIDAFNQYLAELKADSERDQLPTVVSLVTFSDHAQCLMEQKEIERVRPLTKSVYRPQGSTALLDAVCESVTQYRASLGQGNLFRRPMHAPSVLVLVLTDGEENASQRHTYDQAASLIRDCEQLGNWTFAYVGATPEAWTGRESNLFQNRHDARDQTMHEMMRDLNQSTRKMRRIMVEEKLFQCRDLFEKDARDERPPAP